MHSTIDNKFSCQVFVIEKSNFQDQEFNLDDVEITTMRSSGAGGQHINTTDSAIRVVHKKTNIICVCQNERSQFQNKQKALENLKIGNEIKKDPILTLNIVSIEDSGKITYLNSDVLRYDKTIGDKTYNYHILGSDGD
jgi:hypothetical protein